MEGFLHRLEVGYIRPPHGLYIRRPATTIGVEEGPRWLALIEQDHAPRTFNGVRQLWIFGVNAPIGNAMIRRTEIKAGTAMSALFG